MRILIIEDDALLAERIQEIIEEAGHEVNHALTGEEGLSLAEMESHNVIILDMGLPDMSGNDIKKHFETPPIMCRYWCCQPALS